MRPILGEAAKSLIFISASLAHFTISKAEIDKESIGGPYFDVLHGAYEIENLDSNKFRLHLKNEFRLSTHFNFYAGVWTDLILHQIQPKLRKNFD